MPEQYADFTNIIGRVISEPTIRGDGDKRVVSFGVSKRTGFKGPGDQYDPSTIYDVGVWELRRSGERNPLFDQVQTLHKGHRVAVESSEPRDGGQYNPKVTPWNVYRLTDLAEADEGSW